MKANKLAANVIHFAVDGVLSWQQQRQHSTTGKPELAGNVQAHGRFFHGVSNHVSAKIPPL